MKESRQNCGSERSCAIIIPIYNEEMCVADTVERMKEVSSQMPEYHFEIICINDGSTDGTSEVLASIKDITVLTHDVNRGYGAALRTGLDYCSHEWAFITDADGTYDLEDLGRLLAAMGPGIDMVVGARSGIGISANPAKRVARWILRKMVHGLTGVMVPDLNSGLRVFRRSLYSEFRHLLPMGFSFTTTITVSSLYSGYHIRYVPSCYHKRVGKSGIKPIRDFMSFAILIIRLASYFEPLKFFLPATFAIFALGLARGVRDMIVSDHLGNVTVILFLLSFQTFVIGVLADVVVRRAQAAGKD
jgi:glycosyltransferase involved in cell wall biosynthesis